MVLLLEVGRRLLLWLLLYVPVLVTSLGLGLLLHAAALVLFAPGGLLLLRAFGALLVGEVEARAAALALGGLRGCGLRGGNLFQFYLLLIGGDLLVMVVVGRLWLGRSGLGVWLLLLVVQGLRLLLRVVLARVRRVGLRRHGLLVDWLRGLDLGLRIHGHVLRVVGRGILRKEGGRVGGRESRRHCERHRARRPAGNVQTLRKEASRQGDV